jgi:hypothetical protein
MIANSADKSARDQYNAYSAMVAKINSVKVQQTQQNPLQNFFGIKSQSTIEAQKAEIIKNYDELRAAGRAYGQLTTADMVNLTAAKNAKLKALDDEFNAARVASEKAAASAQMAEQKKLGESMAAEVERRIANQKAEAAAWNKIKNVAKEAQVRADASSLPEAVKSEMAAVEAAYLRQKERRKAMQGI